MRSFRAASQAVLAGMLVLASGAQAAGPSLRQQLIGTWSFVTVYAERPDGSRVEPFQPYGPDLKGITMFDADGRFSFVLIGADRPKFAASSRLAGTPAEYIAAMRRSLAYWGTWSVDEAHRRVTLHIERSTYPNFDGTDRVSTVTLAGDRFNRTEAALTTPQGPAVPHNVWERAKPSRAP